MQSKQGLNIDYFVIAILLVFLFQLRFAYRNVVAVSYTDLMRYADDGKIASMVVTRTTMRGEFKQPMDGKKRRPVSPVAVVPIPFRESRPHGSD